MIPSNNSNPIETNLDPNLSMAFSLANNAHIIELLSSKIYTDPWKSVVRELITNALDAHVEAGIIDVPIEVTIVPPHGISPAQLIVRDFGFGMNPIEFRKTFLSIGISSKATDNLTHGGYGIGALTIFAISSQAALWTVSQTLKYEYLLYRDGKNADIPTAACTSTTSTTEVGTKISIPIDLKNFQEVVEAVAELTAFVTPSPTVSGIDESIDNLSDYLQLVKGKYLQIHALGCDYFTPKIARVVGVDRILPVFRIGQIAYPLDRALFSKISEIEPFPAAFLGVNSSLFRRYRSNCSYLVIPIPIGVLDLPANREYIAPTEKNIALMAEILVAAHANIAAEYALALTKYQSINPLETPLNNWGKLKCAVAFGCRQLTLEWVSCDRGGGEEAIVKTVTVDLAAYTDRHEYRTNVNITDDSSVLQSKTVTVNRSILTSKYYDFDDIYYATQYSNIKIQLIYFLGVKERMRQEVMACCDTKGKIVRIFETEAELQSTLAIECHQLVQPLIIRSSFVPSPRSKIRDRSLISFTEWYQSTSPVGLKRIFFDREQDSKTRIKAVVSDWHPSRAPGRRIYYFTEQNFTASVRLFYATLQPYLPAGIELYYLDNTALSILATAPTGVRMNWVCANTLFDRVMADRLKMLMPIFNTLGVCPAPTFLGCQRLHKIDWLCKEAVAIEASLLEIFDRPLAAEVFGDLIAEAKMFANSVPVFYLGLAVYHDCESLFPELAQVRLGRASVRWANDEHWAATLKHYLQSLIAELPLISSHGIFRSINLENCRSIGDSLSAIAILQAHRQININ
jgi:Histidine kinase-, DNA gyrase B-, and HSP90-like ATPase